MALRSRWIEVIVGAFVLVGVAMLAFALLSKFPTSKSSVGCYAVTAMFSNVDGLSIGDEVRVSGVKIGNVTAISLNQASYTVTVDTCINRDVALSVDSTAKISSRSVFEGKFINVVPGADKRKISGGGEIENTQSDINFNTLLPRIIDNFLK